MIVTSLTDLERYSTLSSNLETAVNFIKNLDLNTVKVGPLEIDNPAVSGSCFEYIADGIPGEMFENHERYIDIHLTANGIEQMAISSYPSVTVTEEYNEETDIAFFTGKVEQLVTLYPGNCLITFPEDLHQPKVRYNDDSVRKVVIKVEI